MENIKDEYLDLTQYAAKYYNIQQVESLDMFKSLHSLENWKERRNLSVFMELCLCCPYSNATLERFFNYMKVIKTDWGNRSNQRNLTDLLRIKVSGPTLLVFAQEYCSEAIKSWNNTERRLNTNKKRKVYKKRVSKVKSCKMSNEFIDNLVSSSSDENSEEENELTYVLSFACKYNSFYKRCMYLCLIVTVLL